MRTILHYNDSFYVLAKYIDIYASYLSWLKSLIAVNHNVFVMGVYVCDLSSVEMSVSLVLPCDTPGWFDVKQKLIEAKNVAGSCSQKLIAYLQKVSASVTASSQVHDCTGARPKTRNIYADLPQCLGDQIPVEQRDAYLTRILLHAVDRAIALETHRPSDDILMCRYHRGMIWRLQRCVLLLSLKQIRCMNIAVTSKTNMIAEIYFRNWKLASCSHWNASYTTWDINVIFAHCCFLCRDRQIYITNAIWPQGPTLALTLT